MAVSRNELDAGDPRLDLNFEKGRRGSIHSG
jgi:hypothetical protein